ncbi:proline dehydrogenase [Virgibacillus phasianinus]|uniref:proline dehydrogenase n=1 Tax=Virgibacillus phasianinus TaxID=2017483 RepID=A0A220U3X3_9BACI|nr:proline dehydrogenase [Virgibacillus phasianinus]ASK62807.1 proline dehydrogenase [Virgibacillus phasianinus]
MEQLMRNFFLFLSKNKTLTKLAKKYGFKFGASRFVAGVDIDHAATKIKEINDSGYAVTIDHLGEFIDNEKEARESADECIHAMDIIKEKNLDSQISLKLTSMGLDVSEELVMENMRRILDAGKEKDVTVTIDMEDYERHRKTLDIFKELKKDYENLGTVIQAYLYETEDDIKELNEYNPYLRLVKGAYKEPQKVAYPLKKDVDENYKKVIKLNLENGNYTAIGTHDEAIIDYVKQLEDELNLSRDQFEFQMLFGIRKDLQEKLMKEGYKMRVYVPYGDDWFGYNMRRLAERPANVMFVLKGVFKK